ncbi:MAG: hypothetical protein CSA26_03780 [Desulfobacterales bacterium]|nr:MAG: hypothetical protein CSA26_03780 [Desulfobacterales bacterium]
MKSRVDGQGETTVCSCRETIAEEEYSGRGPVRTVLAVAAGVLVWFLIYRQLETFSIWFTYSLLAFERESRLGMALQFFIYDAPKIMMLLTLIIFLVGIIRSYITVEWSRAFLSGKRTFFGHGAAAFLGVATPFCSCSAVPLFIGFMTAGIPVGVTFSFLIAAPMVNEIALVMLYGLLGWRVALLYFITGISIAVIAGWVLGRLRLERYIEGWVLQIRAGEAAIVDAHMSFVDRILFGLDAVRDIVGKVWFYVIVGIAVGAGIHGYIPDGYLAGMMGSASWWSVPLSVLIGVPVYTNAAGVIPVIDALLDKGAALGTVLAFMMSVTALSFPEMIILRNVLKPKLIALFIGVVASGILLVGYLFNGLGGGI